MDPVVLVIAGCLLALTVASGMLGLGVAFTAVPFLGFFMPDLVHQVQPLSLFSTGDRPVRGGRLRPQPAGGVAAGDPAHHRRRDHGAPGLLAGPVHRPGMAVGPVPDRRRLPRLADVRHTQNRARRARHTQGPGPAPCPAAGHTDRDARRHARRRPGVPAHALILVGYEPKHAAGITAVAITLPSFTALIPHISTAGVDLRLAAVLVVVGAATPAPSSAPDSPASSSEVPPSKASSASSSS